MNQDKTQMLEDAVRRFDDNITGILIQKDGERRYEDYFHGYAAENSAHVYSVTKSVFSALIGIAIEKGMIKSVEQKVLDFYPDCEILPNEKTIQHVTIRHLLTMTAPYKYETEPYLRFFTSQNPIWDALDLLGGEKQIGVFNYSAIGGTHILSGILSRATGQSTLAFATKYLFDPLGIRAFQNILIKSEEEHIALMRDPNSRGWVVDPQGNNFASWGLFLTPREMAKIGQLYLDGGVWEGKKIVPAAWVAESTKEHSRAGNVGSLVYGYLWWVVDSVSFAAMGDGGNVIYINRKERIVICVAGFFKPDIKDRIGWIKTGIEPLLL